MKTASAFKKKLRGNRNSSLKKCNAVKLSKKNRPSVLNNLD